MRRTTRPLSSLPTTVPAVKWHKAQFFFQRCYRWLGENQTGTTDLFPLPFLPSHRDTVSSGEARKNGAGTATQEQDLNAVCPVKAKCKTGLDERRPIWWRDLERGTYHDFRRLSCTTIYAVYDGAAFSIENLCPQCWHYLGSERKCSYDRKK